MKNVVQSSFGYDMSPKRHSKHLEVFVCGSLRFHDIYCLEKKNDRSSILYFSLLFLIDHNTRT
jgi:hypothetical protein